MVCVPRAHVEVRGHLMGTGSLQLPCGSQRLNSGHRAWRQVPLPTKPPHLGSGCGHVAMVLYAQLTPASAVQNA